MALGTSLQCCYWGSMGKVVKGLGTSSYSLTVPPARKVARSIDNVGSYPESSSMSNLTCFFFQSLGGHSSTGSCGEGHSSECVRASSLHSLLQNSHSHRCRWGSPREQPSFSSAGHDHGALREGNWCLLGCWARDSSTFLTFPYP